MILRFVDKEKELWSADLDDTNSRQAELLSILVLK